MSCELASHLWVDSRCALAESPRWDDRANELIWVDLEVGDLWRCTNESSARRTSLGRATGVVVPRAEGGYLTAGPRGFMWTDDDGAVLRIVDIPGVDWDAMRMNDGVCDPRGRLLCGTTPWVSGAARGALYQLDGDGAVRLLIDDVGMSNGMGWSPDGRSFHHVDSLAHTVTTYDYDLESGSVSNPRTFATIDAADGMPDGLAVDAEGGVWLAIWGGGRVLHFSADADLLDAVTVPARYVTACTFGGAHLDELYITTARTTMTEAQLVSEPHAGGIFTCRLPNTTGQPLVRFVTHGARGATATPETEHS